MMVNFLFQGFRYFLMSTTILCSLLLTNTVLASAMSSASGSEAGRAIQQYAYDQHVLGFDVHRVYVANAGGPLIESFIGANPVHPLVQTSAARPHSGKQAFEQISYTGLWEGIDLHYQTSDKGFFETLYTIHPDADPERVQLSYNLDFDLMPDGSLSFAHPGGLGWYALSAPVAWQVIEGSRYEVEVVFNKSADSTLGFRLGTYDDNHPVQIDPVYQWHTFYGGNGNDGGSAIAVDDAGNIYITGSSDQSWLGPNNETPIHPFSKYDEIMIMKLDSRGTYQWHTFYGSASGADYGYGIAVDSNGVYVAGRTGDSWQGDGNTDPIHASSMFEIAVIKLNHEGVYQWHTFHGAGNNGYDFGYAIDTDTLGNVYVAGYSDLSWQGGASNDIDPVNPHSGGGSKINNAIILKLDTDGAYQWHTFHGGSSGEMAYAVSVDGSGNVYAAGWSRGTWQGPGDTDPLHAYTTSANIMAFKLNSSGTYQWHTFYGAAANGWEIGKGIAVDPNNDVYISGYTQAPWLGDNDTDPLHAHSDSGAGSAYDITVIKLDSDGAYQWHTFYGSNSSNDDESNAIAIGREGGIYVAASSRANWLGDSGQAPLHAHSDAAKALTVLKLLADGSYQWHTFYGSSTTSEAFGITLDSVGNILVTGSSQSSWLADNDRTPLNGYTVKRDITVLKLLAESCTFVILKTPADKAAAFCL